MAVLNEQNRFEIFAQWMRENLESIPITKPELRALFDAADDWVDANAASYNAALPQPGRGALNANQKTAILVYVVTERRRAGV